MRKWLWAKYQLMFCETLECPIHKQFPFTISLKLPIILTEQVLLLSLLRWGKKGGIIRLLGQRPLNPTSLTLESALYVSEQSRKQKNANSPHLPRVTAARERSQTDTTYIRDQYFSWDRRTVNHKWLITRTFTLKIKLKYVAIPLLSYM